MIASSLIRRPDLVHGDVSAVYLWSGKIFLKKYIVVVRNGYYWFAGSPTKLDRS
jgi:hypothetical protein